jgi:NADP+-dependent farnesol dehydrogenase
MLTLHEISFQSSSHLRHAATAITECIRQEFQYLYQDVKITAISPGLVEGQDTDILTQEEQAHGKMPALAPKDVSAAVLYALSVKDSVQVINCGRSCEKTT